MINRFLTHKLVRLVFTSITFAFLLLLPQGIDSKYWMRLINLSLINIITVIGLDFSWGLCGQVSFGHAAFYAIGAYTSAILMVDHGFSFWAAVPFVLLVSLAFGFIIGFPTLRLKAQYLALVTIGFQQITYIVLKTWKDLTHGAIGIGHIPMPTLGGITISNDYSYYYLILFFTVLASIGYIRIHNSRLGRAMEAIRESHIASEVMGIPTTLIKIYAFALSAIYAGIGGYLYGSLVRYVGPESFTFAKSVDFLTMLLVGGPGSFAGSVIGAPLLTILPEWLRFLKQYTTAVNGAMIIIFFIFKPEGLWGLVQIMIVRIKKSMAERMIVG